MTVATWLISKIIKATSPFNQKAIAQGCQVTKAGKKDIFVRKKNINGANHEKKDKIFQNLFPL